MSLMDLKAYVETLRESLNRHERGHGAPAMELAQIATELRATAQQTEMDLRGLHERCSGLDRELGHLRRRYEVDMAELNVVRRRSRRHWLTALIAAVLATVALAAIVFAAVIRANDLALIQSEVGRTETAFCAYLSVQRDAPQGTPYEQSLVRQAGVLASRLGC
jgi:hypothetical protein